MDRNPPYSAARGATLEDVAGKILAIEFLEASLRPALHRFGVIGFGVIGTGLDRHKTDFAALVLELNGFAGNTKPDFEFRTNRNPFDMPANDVRQEMVLLVAAVIANSLAQQAGRNTDANGVVSGHG